LNKENKTSTFQYQQENHVIKIVTLFHILKSITKIHILYIDVITHYTHHTKQNKTKKEPHLSVSQQP